MAIQNYPKTLGTFVNRFYHSNINLKEASFEVDSLALDYLVGSCDIPMILSIRIQLMKTPQSMVKYTSSKHFTSWDGNGICYDQLVILVPTGIHWGDWSVDYRTQWSPLPMKLPFHLLWYAKNCSNWIISPSSDENKTCLTPQPGWTPQLSIFWHHSISYAYSWYPCRLPRCVLYEKLIDWCYLQLIVHRIKEITAGRPMTLLCSIVFFTRIMKNVEKSQKSPRWTTFFPSQAVSNDLAPITTWSIWATRPVKLVDPKGK